LPDCAEKDVALLAAAKAGFRAVEIDSNITDVHDFREALRISNAKVLYFYPQKNNFNYIQLLRKAIPEFFHCKRDSVCFLFIQIHYFFFLFYSDDDTYGQFFHSKHFPQLTYFVHLGANSELGKRKKQLFICLLFLDRISRLFVLPRILFKRSRSRYFSCGSSQDR
jgi:hypothetical protein